MTIERQIHHYGSALNALALLSSFRDEPTDTYLLRVGYAGTMAPLSNIHEDGFASCAMHARPEHLSWDAYSGDYGPGFVGMVLGSGVYLVEDPDVGMVAYGGIVTVDSDAIKVEVRDAVRQKIFVGPLGLEAKIDAGIIESFTYNINTGAVTLTIGQVASSPRAEEIILWTDYMKSETETEESLSVTRNGRRLEEKRGGKLIHMGDDDTIEIEIG